MDNTHNIDDFLAYSELMKSYENTENLTDEEVSLLDEKFSQDHNLPTNRAMLIMKAAFAIEEIVRIEDCEEALRMWVDFPAPKEIQGVWLAVGDSLHKRTKARKKK